MKRKRLDEEACELIRTHLARSHRELAMTNPTESADVSVDRHVVRRIAKHQIGTVAIHERRIGTFLQRTCARDPVFAEQPEIARTRYWRSAYGSGKIIRAVLLFRLGDEPFDAKIDLAHIEASRLKAEIQVGHRQLAELFCEQAIVPDRVLAQLVIGN